MPARLIHPACHITIPTRRSSDFERALDPHRVIPGPFPVWLTRVEFVIASLLMRGSFDGIDQTPLH